MNRAELVAEVAKKSGSSKAECDRVLGAFIDTVKKEAKKGGKVVLVGFGTFSVLKRKATTGVNPKTREKIKIPAKKVLKFSTSDVVNNALNGK